MKIIVIESEGNLCQGCRERGMDKLEKEKCESTLSQLQIHKKKIIKMKRGNSYCLSKLQTIKKHNLIPS